MAEVTESQTKKSARKISPVAWLTSLAVVSVAAALIAVFVLSEWAEASLLGHGVQHVVIFLAGLGFGTSMLAIYQTKGKKNES